MGDYPGDDISPNNTIGVPRAHQARARRRPGEPALPVEPRPRPAAPADPYAPRDGDPSDETILPPELRSRRRQPDAPPDQPTPTGSAGGPGADDDFGGSINWGHAVLPPVQGSSLSAFDPVDEAPAPSPAAGFDDFPSYSDPMPPPPVRETPRPAAARPPAPRQPPPRPAEEPGCRTILRVQGDTPDDGLPPPIRAVAIEMLKPARGPDAWDPIGVIEVGNEEPITIGRLLNGRPDRALPGLAARHFSLRFDDDQVTIEPLDSLNGIFLRLHPGEDNVLRDGTRFLIGRHVVEFLALPPAEEPPPRTSPDGEVFRSRPLRVLAALDFLGPDGEVSARVPLTKPDVTALGRSGEKCDIALPDDDLVSRVHAHVVRREGCFYLRDANSTNGTFLQIERAWPLNVGSRTRPKDASQVLAGDSIFRLVDIF